MGHLRKCVQILPSKNCYLFLYLSFNINMYDFTISLLLSLSLSLSLSLTLSYKQSLSKTTPWTRKRIHSHAVKFHMHGQLCTASVKNKFLSSPICLPSNMLMYSLISQFNFQMPVYFLLSKNLIITPKNFMLCHYSIFQEIFLVSKKRRDASKTTFVNLL